MLIHLYHPNGLASFREHIVILFSKYELKPRHIISESTPNAVPPQPPIIPGFEVSTGVVGLRWRWLLTCCGGQIQGMRTLWVQKARVCSGGLLLDAHTCPDTEGVWKTLIFWFCRFCCMNFGCWMLWWFLEDLKPVCYRKLERRILMVLCYCPKRWGGKWSTALYC